VPNGEISFAPISGLCGDCPMRLLVTNDDGIDCVFLHELVRALTAAGHDVLVVAPKSEQSWIGAAKSRHRPVACTVADRALGCPTWVVDGTPSDCVNIGLAHLLPQAGHPRPDAVVSGINVGLNASLAFILASGTIAGAWEGALHGLPAVALSQDLTFEAFDRFKHDAQATPELLGCLRVTARHAVRLVAELVPSTPPRSFLVHNLNFPYPCPDDTPLRRTVPAQVIVPGLFSPAADDGTHRFVFKLGDDVSPASPLTDRAALAMGAISHTMLNYGVLGHPAAAALDK
jgi:5'-nucleotidase